MGHVPHLLVAKPWASSTLALSTDQKHHLEKVLRVRIGSDLSYTDGEGIVGLGVLGPAGIERGEETRIERPSDLTVAVSPPRSKQRTRYLVEKLAELGVERLLWVRASRTEGRPPPPEKALAWATSGLEQSRGGWLMQLGVGEVAAFDTARTVVADMDGTAPPDLASPILLVGPEGGWADDETRQYSHRMSLGPTVLRVETAALAGAVLLSFRRP